MLLRIISDENWVLDLCMWYWMVPWIRIRKGLGQGFRKGFCNVLRVGHVLDLLGERMLCIPFHALHSSFLHLLTSNTPDYRNFLVYTETGSVLWAPNYWDNQTPTTSKKINLNLACAELAMQMNSVLCSRKLKERLVWESTSGLSTWMERATRWHLLSTGLLDFQWTDYK